MSWRLLLTKIEFYIPSLDDSQKYSYMIRIQVQVVKNFHEYHGEALSQQVSTCSSPITETKKTMCEICSKLTTKTPKQHQ